MNPSGLAPANLRLDQPPIPTGDPDIIVQVSDSDSDDLPTFDNNGAVVEIAHGDGTLTISLDGKPISTPSRDRGTVGWFSNLVEDINPSDLSTIAEDLLRGIANDEASRKEWIEQRATGLQLAGLRLDVPGLQGATDGAPVEGMSKIRHPLLLEATLRFQANSRSELLPTDGPVKVRDDSNGSTPATDSDANALELDLNHYLTAVATEYYPDTDQMLFMLGLGGTEFKKVYNCPLRMRPVSETVYAPDLVVSNTATDLANAQRVTHKIMMRPSTVKRMQLLGVYRDIPLSTPNEPEKTSLDQEKASQQGIDPSINNPEDRDRQIFECYCELDIPGFEHTYKGKISGLEVPYVVTIDVTSREILSLTRNYRQPDPARPNLLPTARKRFVKYTYVPGPGFWGIGLLHILGNTTNALTAAVREMLDNGMYANFPGFLMADTGARQNSNIFRVPPGGSALVKTAGMKIGDAIMPLPYSTQQMGPLMALLQYLDTSSQRLGGTSELQVGEGRADAPVGTTLAMIEQATKIENSVHKRLHAAQAEEFKLLVECFRENPDAFLGCDCPSNHQWDEATFLRALDNCLFVPQADPNTSSHSQRILKVQALVMWAMQNPSMADPIAVSRTALAALGWSNPDQFMVPPSAMGQPPPQLLQAQAKMKADQQDADAKTLTAQAKMKEATAKAAQPPPGQPTGPQPPDPLDAAKAQAALMDAQTRRSGLAITAHQDATEDHNRDLDREAKERETYLDIAKEVLSKPQDAQVGAGEVANIEHTVDSGAPGGGQ